MLCIAGPGDYQQIPDSRLALTPRCLLSKAPRAFKGREPLAFFMLPTCVAQNTRDPDAGTYDKRGGGTRVFGSTAKKTRFFAVDSTTRLVYWWGSGCMIPPGVRHSARPTFRTLAYYENEAQYEAHPQRPLKLALPLALYKVGAIASPQPGAPHEVRACGAVFEPHSQPQRSHGRLSCSYI